MLKVRIGWKDIGITRKFSMVFSLFLTLLITIAATGYISFRFIHDAEEGIARSRKIEQLVLAMDRNLEKARRLHGDFFLHYQTIGLAKAHELYAQKSVRQIARAIEHSTNLKKMLSQSEVSKVLKENKVDVTLYLSSAKRFADTSIESVELITRRAAPEWGLETRITTISESLRSELKSLPNLISNYEKALSSYKDYLLSRNRFLMQSSFNTLDLLKDRILKQSPLAHAQAQESRAVSLLGEFQEIAGQLLDVDLAIKGKFHDFSLQAQAVVNIPTALLKETRSEIQGDEDHIRQIHWLAGSIMLTITCIGLLILLVIARVMNESITHNILRLTGAAQRVMQGDMDVVVPQKSQDELGQLAAMFNKMVARLKNLLDNLEGEVQKRTAELSESEYLYRQLFDQSSSGIAVYEAFDNGNDFVIKDFNRAGENIEKTSKSELIDRKVTEVFPIVEETGLLGVFQQVWQSGDPMVYPFCFYRDGKLEGCRDNRVYKLPSGAIVAVYDDTTAQKRIEEEKKSVEDKLQRAQKMEAIAVLAGGVAHDLNNILSGIIGYPELILYQLPGDSELRSSIEAIKESGERAAAVVADLLTVARGVASTKKVASINTLIMEYMDSPEFKKLKNTHPDIQYREQLSETSMLIHCSTVHVKKCIMNLVTNGSEAIHDTGEVCLSTRLVKLGEKWAVEHEMKPGNYSVLRVADNGIGIPRKDIDHIFEPFYTKKVMGKSGTGLGLAVVWNTLRDHHGSVIVESTDKLTYFDLYFPVAGESVISGPKKTENKAIGGNGEKILVVDDEQVQRDISYQMLSQLGYSVISKKSGEEAIVYLQDYKADLVLLDMIMDPGINGCETYRQIAVMHPGQKAIIISGYSEDEEVCEARRLGAKGFLKKPYSMEQLGEIVRKELVR